MTQQTSELAFASGDSALMGLVLLVGGLALAPLTVVVARRVFPGRNLFFARWGFSHLGAVLGFGLLTRLFFGGAAAQLMDLGPAPILIAIVAQALMMASVCALIALYAERLDPDGMRCLGFRSDRNLRAMVVGVLSYVLLFPALSGVSMLWPWAMEQLGLEHEAQAVAVELVKLQGPSLAVAVVFAVIVLPFFEELVFRSFLQPLLVQNLGDRGGVVLTSVLFGAMHGASAFLPIFAFSLILGFVMLRTQRIAGPWLVHAIHNGLMVFMLIQYPEMREMMGHEQ